ncbi:MAG: peptidoglycan-binding domain-containing protein [Leucobacter sp.]
MKAKTRSRLLILPLLAALIGIGVPLTGTLGATPAQAASCTSYKYSYGGTGTCVKYIQQILNGASANGQSSCKINGKWVGDARNYLTADGKWGTLTKNRVTSFQRSHCLVADGIVGAKSWSKLCEVGRQSGYYLSGPGWYNKNDRGDRFRLAAYKSSVYAGCNHAVSWPKLLKL